MANLYTWYDNGTFEGSVYHYGFNNAVNGATVGYFGLNTGGAFAGAQSGKIVITNPTNSVNSAKGIEYLRTKSGFGTIGLINLTPGKKYKMKAKVRVPSSNPIASPNTIIGLGDTDFSGGASFSPSHVVTLGDGRLHFVNPVTTGSSFAVLDAVLCKVSQALDTWVDLEWTWLENSSGSIPGQLVNLFACLKYWPGNAASSAAIDVSGSSNVFNSGGELWIDNITLDEVVVCNLAFSSPASSKTDETSAGGNNGTITINATSSASKQYSINNTTWQTSNVFTGVAPGTYTIYVKDSNGCSIQQNNVVINAFVAPPPSPCDLVFASPAFSKTNETSSGGNNGAFTLFANGSRTKQFSKNGTVWQSSNTFTGLAPGTYSGYVKDTANCSIQVNNIVIAAFSAPPPTNTPAPLTIDLKPVNSYNFISWFATDGDIAFNSIQFANCYWDLPKAYRLNKFSSRKHRPVVINNEEFTFYINFDQNFGYGNFSSLRLNLINSFGNIQSDIAPLQRVFMDDNINYFIYASVTLGAVEIGNYRLAIVDTSNNNSIVYVSNEIEVLTQLDASKYTIYVNYRSSTSAYRFLYEKITTFFNKIRLRMNVLEEHSDGNLTQYRAASNGRLRNVSVDLDRHLLLETYWFDDLAHRAMDVFQIDDKIYLNFRLFVVKSLYKVEWNQGRLLNKGKIEMYDQDFSTSNRYGNETATLIENQDPFLLGDNGGRIKL